MIRLSLLSSAFLVFASFVIWIAAGALEAAQERQVTYRYVAGALEAASERNELVSWKDPLQPLKRPFTPFDAKLIGRSLGEAWQIFAVSQETGEPTLLADRFTGVAETRAEQAVMDATDFGGRMVVLSQTAQPRFFHKDGSLFQAEVEMIVARYLSSDNETLKTYTITQETGIATLINESNGWRVFSYERRTSADLPAAPVPWSGTLNGVNYYPAETPWRHFWPNFDADTIAEDFDLVTGLKANAVRVFLVRDAFLGPDYLTALEDLETLLALAAERNIQVVPTLFDLKQDFNLGTWADDAVYLERVLPVLQSADAVAFVDLKNEPDLDFKYHGTAKVTAWLKSIQALTRLHAPDLPLTIGWSAANFANVLIDQLDVVTYHDYAPLSSSAARLAEVKKVAGAKSVLVTEIGDTTYELILSYPSSPEIQAQRIDERLESLAASDGAFIWTLHDFQYVDGTVVGASPLVQRKQAAFGLFHADGTEKPAASIIRQRFLDGS